VSLAPGSRLGPYEIVALLGAGGMGEVYRARDTRLDRPVAVKILSPDVASSPDARQRFEREARTVSQLSHPHICALYDVGHEGATEFLVMELLEGETLAERLKKGPLATDRTLRFGVQIADALDKAHRQGIIHRDLKPANVMVTKAGVKLLDFGLAKAAQPAVVSDGQIAETAFAGALTEAGTFLGTLQYMSPEQLEGRPADARSDIFALGTLLFEMATGQKAFAGNSRIALASAVLQQEPPTASSLNQTIPRALDALIRGCLAKDPDERWQTAHDVRLQLAAMIEPSSAGEAMPVARRRALPAWLPWIVAAGALVLAAAAWLRPSELSAPAPLSARFAISPPPGGAFSDTVETLCITLAPDGSQLAFVASDAGGERHVWLRPLSAVDARALPGTEGARAVIWSPDGRSIAFFAGDKLKRIDLPDGTPVTLSDVPNVRVTGTWGAKDILFSAVPGGIYRVPATGGAAAVERAPAGPPKEIAITWPWFLPDGRQFLYLTRGADGLGTVMVAEIGKPARKVLDVVSSVQYVDPGYLVFSREGTLVAQRFDAASAQVSGEPFAIVEPVRYFFSTGAATFTTSRTGVLVYQSHLERGRVVWLDRAGNQVGVVSDSTSHSNARISPDGTRVLFDRARPQLGSFDLWTFEIERGIEQQLTSDRLSETRGLWLSADSIMFSGRVPPHLMRKNLVTGAEEEVIKGGLFTLAEDVSPDGRILAFTQRTARGNFDIWTLPLNGSPPSPLMETPADETSVRFSPDGRFIAYASDESGRYEVYVSPFPVTATKTRISAAGGTLPRWNRDGRELLYLGADLQLVSIPVRTAPTLTVGAPRRLFAVKSALKWDDMKAINGWSDWDVSRDGTRFLAVVPQPANEQALTAVLDWRTRKP
jgi:eukaryotic-like serine/threonine-protein kinase